MFKNKRGFILKSKNFGATLRDKEGFTLIELLAIIAIIGLLSTIVIVDVSSSRQRARDSKRVADIKQLGNAMELFYGEYGTYKPTGCAEANTVVSSCAGAGRAGLADFIGAIGRFNDPSADPAVLCPAGSCSCGGCGGCSCNFSSCNYTFLGADENTYSVAFFLEGDAGDLAAGLHFFTPEGTQ